MIQQCNLKEIQHRSKATHTIDFAWFTKIIIREFPTPETAGASEELRDRLSR